MALKNRQVLAMVMAMVIVMVTDMDMGMGMAMDIITDPAITPMMKSQQV